MTSRFFHKYGPIHKKETTQHEKNLTWVVKRYADSLGVKVSDESESNTPYFGQEYNNLTFKIGYRIGVKEGEDAYQRGYNDALECISEKLEIERQVNE